MTPRVVAGLQSLSETETKTAQGTEEISSPHSRVHDESSLTNPAVGNPISHPQIVDLWKALGDTTGEYTLEMLLKGAKVYVAPPAPKPEPSSQYKALMARLRREEEQREYDRMANPLPPMETFSQRYPHGANMAQAFAAVNRPTHEADMGDDDVTYADVHRQLMLILNFVASILGVAATLWIVARWWSTPARLFLTMGGSLLVGVAEVAVYSGYVWHLGEAKKRDESLREVKEVLQTWTVGADGKGVEAVRLPEKAGDQDAGVGRRQKSRK
ncbi:endoplasmic reticulum-based factor for assembly of V-ATPase-domain-containing protein [Dichotomopilus funicola]|uniref:Endoplasmic reticulum-based factor for assembly of V-ATPase-domain-containing protein n=1 Tax=Dichotomopilus funicola TaxID=1934379 RepID=A0AAN6UWK1_9PEZI|nr:endoplasmic reticulum-based factor for assembly of V-ATPase-domain-containing protein [Dichotomopilus funicola]